ncbi:hypothetical protein BCIN_08g03960 [Botrytis cinerea B05.10]|uniref:Transcription factor protein n=1 Tax=Botryotinia fuckeliana (strain B05.10) TaxID=332648 RepID=A0A384JQ97_BOTFB|nr:hypothetical protein BCIN_08g03960 [Botrytis cinerea B05.10]ATZ52756.1 hypothetical protein BCIN_08g03960 [Botrytis cinerea B05.10]
MSRRDDRDSRASRSQPQPAPVARTGQFVIDAEGIDREVITADICRYLGNDALVKPGDVEDPRTKQLKPVYVITAYRNLTNAMIFDLKQASADWRAERLARSNAQYPTNVVDYRSSNALDQSIARMDRMDATQPRPAAQQGMYNSPSAAVPSSQSYQPSGQGYSAGYSQPTSYQNDGYTQPSSQPYAPSTQGYPHDSRTYIHGSNYSVAEPPAGRGGSVPQSTPRTQYPPSTSYQAPAAQYYSQSGPPASTPAYAAHAPTDPYYSSRGNYESTPEIYDNRAYPESSDYQMQDAGYTEPGSSYQEPVSYSQPMPSGRSGTATSSSQRPRDRDSRDDRDRHHQRRRN